MVKVMFVCWGNICRSPMAEFVLKDLAAKRGLADRLQIASAATSDEEIYCGVGNPVYPPAREELARHGISCAGKRAVQLTRADYDRYDYLIGMERMNLRYMRSICGGDPQNKMHCLLDYTARGGDISDPWYTGDFESTWNDVSEGCAAFLDALVKSGELSE